jgi:Zn-dependent protease with chaperone function
MGETTQSGFPEQTLSEKNYPELHKDVQQLQSQMQRDFPNETLPPVTIVDRQSAYAEYNGPDGKGERVEISSGIIDALGGGKTLESREKITAIIAHEYGHDIRNDRSDIDVLRAQGKTDSQIVEYNKRTEEGADALAAQYVDPKHLSEALQKGLDSALKMPFSGIDAVQKQSVMDRIRILNEGKSHEAHPSEVHCAPTPNAAPKRQHEGGLGH